MGVCPWFFDFFPRFHLINTFGLDEVGELGVLAEDVNEDDEDEDDKGK